MAKFSSNYKLFCVLIPALIVTSHFISGNEAACSFTVGSMEGLMIRENATVGSLAITIPITGKAAWVTPLKTKYFELDLGLSQLFLRPTTSLPSYFQTENNSLITIHNITLGCNTGGPYVAPAVEILVIHKYYPQGPHFGPPLTTYEFNLPHSGAPINWQLFIKVSPGDFSQSSQQFRFTASPSDLIQFTPDPPERVPADVDLPIEYYKVYFGLNRILEDGGNFGVHMSARDGYGNVGYGDFLLKIGKDCGVVTDIDQALIIPDTAAVGEPALTLDVKFVKSIDLDVTQNPVIDLYFSLELDAESQKIYLIPKPTFPTFFDQEDGPELTLHGLHLFCPGVNDTVPNIFLKVNDTNDHSPVFDPVSENYYVVLPYESGDIVNSEQFIKVMDADLVNENTAIIFSHDRGDLIVFSPSPPERVPTSTSQRLEYYKVYFKLNDNWTPEVGTQVVTIRASNKDGLNSTFVATLEITDVPECTIISDVSQEFVISEDAAIDDVVLTLDVQGGLSIDLSFDDLNEKYLSWSLDTVGQKINARAKQTLYNYFDDLGNHGDLPISKLYLNCSRGFYIEPIINLRVQDVNNRFPEFDPTSATYSIQLPYFGAPVNWEQFVKVMDDDYDDANTKLTFMVDRKDLIVFTPSPPERVPADESKRLEYYKLYFSLNRDWEEVAGIQNFIITANDSSSSHSIEFPVTLELIG